MASSPLFDLSRIDLDRVEIPPDGIARLLPQTGHMRQLDRVIWMNDAKTQVLGVKEVRDDEFWVSGHIPGRPLLPGVLMIEAAAQVCSIPSRLKLTEDVFIGFTRCNNVSFRGQVVPGDTLYLLGSETSWRPRRFISNTQGIVNGTVVFEGQITGMVM